MKTTALRMLRRIAGVACFAALAAGCASDTTKGYVAEDAFDTRIKTIALPIFTNTTFVKDVQFELADTLSKQVMATTPWRIASTTQADTVLTGKITSVELRRIAKSTRTGLAEQETITMTVDFEWRDQRTGRTLVKRERFSASGLFVPTNLSLDPIEFGRWAAAEAMALAIVDQLRSDW